MLPTQFVVVLLILEIIHSLGEDEVEMGLGIHGEPGAYKRSMATADELVKEVTRPTPDPSSSHSLLMSDENVPPLLGVGYKQQLS